MGIGVLKARGCNVDTSYCPAATLGGDIATVKDETTLDFSGLRITGLPKSLGECKALTLLKLEGCGELKIPRKLIAELEANGCNVEGKADVQIAGGGDCICM